MAIIKGVLQEELNRLERNISQYENMLLKLPRGSIFIRQMGHASFVYRRRKENNKVVSEYLGNINSKNAQEQIKLSNEYKRISQNIRIAKIEVKKLKKAYKVYA